LDKLAVICPLSRVPITAGRIHRLSVKRVYIYDRLCCISSSIGEEMKFYSRHTSADFVSLLHQCYIGSRERVSWSCNTSSTL